MEKKIDNVKQEDILTHEKQLYQIVYKLDNRFNYEINKDKSDIRFILINNLNNKILVKMQKVEIRWWKQYYKRPIFPSGLITIKLSDIKFFIDGVNDIIQIIEKNETTINKLNNIKSIIDNKANFPPKTDATRILILYNSFFNNFCMIKAQTISDSLNYLLKDQLSVNQKIRMQKKFSIIKKSKFDFYKNIWLNPKGINDRKALYPSSLMLILGCIKADNDFLWIKAGELVNKLRK